MNNRGLCIAVASSLPALLLACSTAPTPATTAAPRSARAVAVVAPQPEAAADDLASVYIYRPKAFLGFGLHPTIMLDGEDLINVENGTVWTGRFKPGHYVFLMDDEQSGAELDLKAGAAYYIRVEIVPGFWKGGGRATLMAKEQGSLEIKQLRPLPKDEIEHAAFKKP